MSTTIAILTTEFIPFLIIWCARKLCLTAIVWAQFWGSRCTANEARAEWRHRAVGDWGPRGHGPHISWHISWRYHRGRLCPPHYYLPPQILRTSYGPESCRSTKSSASATLYASSCWKFIADDDRNTTKARNPRKCKVIGIPKFSKPLSNHQIKMGLNPFSRSISIGTNLRLSAKMSEEKNWYWLDLALTVHKTLPW